VSRGPAAEGLGLSGSSAAGCGRAPAAAAAGSPASATIDFPCVMVRDAAPGSGAVRPRSPPAAGGGCGRSWSARLGGPSGVASAPSSGRRAGGGEGGAGARACRVAKRTRVAGPRATHARPWGLAMRPEAGRSRCEKRAIDRSLRAYCRVGARARSEISAAERGRSKMSVEGCADRIVKSSGQSDRGKENVTSAWKSGL
jgi:hypothetical protein